MSYPVIGSDYHRSTRVPRSAREAFGSDMQREREWNQMWDRLIVGFAILICATVLPLIWMGVL